MNLPNKISILRVLLVPIIFLIPVIFKLLNLEKIFLLDVPVVNILMLLLFIIASFSDFLDGYIARKYNLVSDFGKFIDPLADKILVISLIIYFVSLGKIPYVIPIILIFREFAISQLRLVEAKYQKVIAANIYGKIKTFTQMIALIFVFIDKYAFFEFIHLPFNRENCIFYLINIISSVLILISTISAIQSGIVYAKDSKEVFLDA